MVIASSCAFSAFKTCSHFITSRFTSNVMLNLSNVISVSQLSFFERRYVTIPQT